jgi:heme-degrading monooxygenase HmoA
LPEGVHVRALGDFILRGFFPSPCDFQQPKKGGSAMAVKIIIRRKVSKGKEAQLFPLLFQLRAKAVTQPGYISGETLRNANEPEDYLVISTWKSVEDWKAWEVNPTRTEIQNKIDSLLGEKTSFGIYYYG